MNEVERLFNNIKTLTECGTLVAESKVFAEENPELDSIGELNDIIEDEISCYSE